jgi:hypothetical protein
MKHIEMIETVAGGLKDLKDNVVFIGGAVAPFYIHGSASDYPRPTDDVDCVIDIYSLGDRERLENDLQKLGFKHDTHGDGSICRWLYNGIKTDIMPVDTGIFGFSNIWYRGWSHDLEDCILILDSLSSIDEFLLAPESVKEYLTKAFRELLNKDEFVELIESTLKSSSVGTGRTKRLVSMINNFIKKTDNI